MMKLLGKIFAALVFLFIYAPLFVMVFFSFNSSRSTSVLEGFSLKWYTELFSSGETVRALQNTLILALTSAVIATLLGTAAAVAIFKMRRGAFKSSVMTVTNIPMMNPDIVTGVSLMLLFVFIGRFIGTRNSLSFATILIAHITFNLPYVILNVLPKLAQTDRHLSEAALDLGATRCSILQGGAPRDFSRNPFGIPHGVHAFDRRFRDKLLYNGRGFRNSAAQDIRDDEKNG